MEDQPLRAGSSPGFEGTSASLGSAEALEQAASHLVCAHDTGSSQVTVVSVPAATVDAWQPLPRGGYYVRTSAGAVQIGMPPETIKDVMRLGLDVPIAYVLPRELFDRRRGLSVAEFEFPAYYSFFLLKRRCRLVVLSPEYERRVRTVFRETLFGPEGEPLPSEFAEGYPESRRPSFRRESEYFRTVPGKGRLSIDDLIEFVVAEDGVAEVVPGIQVAVRDDVLVVRDHGRDVAALGATVTLPARTSTMDDDEAPPSFMPPSFGVTVLGASHGFDPSGKTTGFLLWMGGRAILVDPPTDTTEYLRARGVAPKTIDGVILTHCHADHDAGTFQKLLEEGQVNLYTTPHILGSFLRKYSALSGLSEDLLRRTFRFHPVRIGAPVHVRGGELWFRYTLHSIPTIGVEAFYGNRSISISADTLYDPERVTAMYEQGILDRARYEDLVAFPEHHSAILHEAGIPPLHTPVSALATLPDEVKERLYLVHIASKDVPPDSGLRAAREGLEYTIRVEPQHAPRFGEAIEMLDIFSMVDFLRDLPMSRSRDLLQVATRMMLPAGEKVVTQGTRGDSFYIIVHGTVEIVKDGVPIKRYRAGDYFGEMAILLDQPRSADAVCISDVELVAIDRNDFLAILRGSEMLTRLERLVRIRDEGAWELLSHNSVLSWLTSAQKTQLQMYLLPHRAAADELLWDVGQTPDRAYLVDDAVVTMKCPEGDLKPFACGAFVGEVDALRSGAPSSSSARVTRAGKLFAIERADLVRFFEDNPGVYLSFLGVRFIE
ncbi:cAMP/cGMP-dependent 3',5'-cyclic-AMP/GMP phosphodiesterase [Labilithrix luteola]|uniref:cAMP/cGMP-dependent 3',5'-cyclic-AMP/GMP phosphodiesterase n=1 Tax=Labilithrix luteola TaxID=1391654 RepID=UPI000A99A262|nr:cAMP/cGMP-dependent 3',5'-cyclic-AMP/GMP phosphodiesterase [Labilithrix luteola]